jgi:hypothetical protein
MYVVAHGTADDNLGGRDAYVDGVHVYFYGGVEAVWTDGVGGTVCGGGKWVDCVSEDAMAVGWLDGVAQIGGHGATVDADEYGAGSRGHCEIGVG